MPNNWVLLAAIPVGWGSLRKQMLLATPDDLRQAQWEAFELLLTRPTVVCLYRAGRGGEPLEPSPWLQRWSQTSGHAWQDACPSGKRTNWRRARSACLGPG